MNKTPSIKGGANPEPLKVLLDNGIFSHSEFAENVVQNQEIQWGSHKHVVRIHGLRRKVPHSDFLYQSQIDALFTIGRLIRERKILPFSSTENRVESQRRGAPIPEFYALKDCEISLCPPPIERTKFRSTINLQDYFAKGGKKDQRKDILLGNANQIAFMDWLQGIDRSSVAELIKHQRLLDLSDFEIQSLEDIEWYQFVCRRSGSSENFPDVFHLWTAERNGMNVFLTLEKTLPNIVHQIRKERQKRIEIVTKVFRPIEFLNWIGIEKPDEVPLESRRFYYFHEIE